MYTAEINSKKVKMHAETLLVKELHDSSLIRSP